MYKKIINFCLILIFFSSCINNKVDENDIDNFISKYEFEDFSFFKDYRIIIRQKNFSETIYMISDSETNIDSVLYFVYVDNFSNKISQIKVGNDKNSIIFQALTDIKIKEIINKYKIYNFPYLSVNNDNSVSINPFFVDMNPYLLRLKTKSDEENIKKNYSVFKHYKKNWYIKD
ncbi:hypothetical protein ASF10_20000 [Flavobacterium sp. Leaf82]|uniref:hypothetical protein n=1 Tax=Flavobacterium sp. Leaf82 TaxID=1736238 RepID=UPI000700E9F6|nr:hypothetical protein [Flavobacterium sp. Leaf82]KQO32743.1 hypothetical protein ASF10_20000 [Flavobacterium sp. Leaf82]